MEEAKMIAVTAPIVSVPRKFKASKPTSSRKRVEAVQGKPANKKRQCSEECNKNSNKRTDLKDFSSGCEYTTNQDDKSHRYSENHPNVYLHDGNKSKSLLLSPHGPVTADHPHDLAGKQIITEIQETYDDLETKIKDLKKETKKYSKKLKHLSKKCLRLKEENDLLMDELKPWCTPEMMLDLERRNPDRSLQSNDA